MRSRRGAAWRLVLGTLMLGLATPGAALAHLERPSYWPDPAADTSVSPPAGGGVPDARSLESAVTGEGPGEVRVVLDGEERTLGEGEVLIIASGVPHEMWAEEAGVRLACHPQDPALAALTQRVKESFDPKHVLNPGRMYTSL